MRLLVFLNAEGQIIENAVTLSSYPSGSIRIPHGATALLVTTEDDIEEDT